MDKDKLKIIVSDLEMLLSALKAEVYSDTESYRYDDIEPQEMDYDEEFEGTWLDLLASHLMLKKQWHTLLEFLTHHSLNLTSF